MMKFRNKTLMMKKKQKSSCKLEVRRKLQKPKKRRRLQKTLQNKMTCEINMKLTPNRKPAKKLRLQQKKIPNQLQDELRCYVNA
jgi:hypothetical protein